MRPVFRIEADGQDVTAKIADRLTDLSLTDDAGLESDRLEIGIDDRDNAVVAPAHGATLKLWLGLSPAPPVYMGAFVVDATGGEGPPDTLRIGAKPADMAGPIRSPKTRAWRDVTLGEIAGTVGAEAGLRAMVGPSIRDTFYPYIGQTAESDLHLLTRLARRLDATAKPADGRLVVVGRGEGAAASGEAIPPVRVRRADLMSWSWNLEERGKYNSVEAEWADTDNGHREKVTAGNGAPSKILRHVHASASEARQAARAELDRAVRGEGELELRFAGFRADIFAGGLVQVMDLRGELTDKWVVKRVQHTLSTGGLLTSATHERKGGEGGVLSGLRRKIACCKLECQTLQT